MAIEITVGQQLELIPDEVIVSIYHINVAYLYYGTVKDAPYPVKNYYKVLLIDPDGQLKDGTHRFSIVCDKIDTTKQIEEVIEDENIEMVSKIIYT